MSEHWDTVYTSKEHDEVSWYQPVPATSVRLVTAACAAGSVIDVGAGASTLADELVARGYDVTVLDVAASALDAVKGRLGDRATYVVGDLLDWEPTATYDVWHDRAVFHFLTDPADQEEYARTVRRHAPGSPRPATTPARWPTCSRRPSRSCRVNARST